MKTLAIVCIFCVIVIILSIVIPICLLAEPKHLAFLPPSSHSNTYSNTPIYFTLTTLPTRLKSDYFHKVIQDHLTHKIDRLIINVPDVCIRSKEPYVLPDWLQNNVDSRIIVSKCRDVGPATKVFGGIHLIPDEAAVIVVDDDILYQPFLVGGLMQAWEREKNVVHCWNANQEPAWVRQNANFWIPSGFAGWVCTAKILKRLNPDDMPLECFSVDDHWFGWAFWKMGISVKPLDRTLAWHYSTKEVNNTPSWFELRLHTNRPVLYSQCLKALQN